MDPITSFRGEHAFLSNFYILPFPGVHIQFTEEGRQWQFNFPTVEHAYQATKCANREDIERISADAAFRPADAKKIGKTVTLRSDWDVPGKRLEVMHRLLGQKFRYPDLRAQLLATGDAHLEEGNNWGDRFWGTVQGQGENHLGKLLMRIRDDILWVVGSDGRAG